MREITAFGLILFVLWMAFPNGSRTIAMNNSMSAVARPASPRPVLPPRPVQPRQTVQSYPDTIYEGGHVFKKIYDDGHKRIHKCQCGLKRISEGG